MARSTKFSTDFNIREALKRNRQLLTGAQETGRTALAGYEELAPQYNQAVERARNYQSTLTRDYNRYVQDRNQAVDTYNTELKKRYSAYQGAYQGAANQYNVELQRRKSVYENISAQGSGLERSYQTAQQGLNRLSGIKDSAAQQANKLYGTYSSQYSAATKTGQQQYQSQLGGYQSEISNLQKNIQSYQTDIANKNKGIELFQGYIQDTQANRLFYKTYTGRTGTTYLVKPEKSKYAKHTIYELTGVTGLGNPITGPGMTISDLYKSMGSNIDWNKIGDYYDVTYNYQTKGKSYTDYVYDQYRSGQTNYQRYKNAVSSVQKLNNNIQRYLDTIAGKQAQIENRNRQIELASGAITRADKNYQDLLKDTGYVTRYAQQQSAGALQNYQRYLQNTYNPSVNTYNQYVSGTYNPAAQAYQNFMGSGQVQQALRDYQSFAGDRNYADRASASQLKAYQDYAADTGYVDRAASDTKAVYDASQQEYSRLQAAYEGMAPQLSEYSQQAETAKQQVLTLAGQAPGLQRSLAIDTEARKRGDRLGYRRSILSQGYKRRGAAR